MEGWRASARTREKECGGRDGGVGERGGVVGKRVIWLQ